MKGRLAVVLIGLVVTFLAFGLFSLTVYNNSHNEQMYVTAGYLMAEGERLYEDFAFVQMPYSPLIYATTYRITGNGYYLLKAKLVNYAFVVIATLLLYVIVQRETRNRLFSVTMLLLFLSNYYIFRATIEASNYTMPVAFSLLAYYLYVRYIDERRRSLAHFFCGIAIAASLGSKFYYATTMVPFALAALVYPRATAISKRIVTSLLPLAAGLFVGALPILYYAARNFDRFYFNNVGYHVLNALWRQQNGSTATLTLASKLDTARDLLANPNYLLLIVWLALSVVIVVGQERPSRHRLSLISPELFLSGLLVMVSVLTAFAPRPLFPQYFAMPIPYMLILMGALYARLPVGQRQPLRRLALIIALISTLIILPRHTRSLRTFVDPNSDWSGVKAANASLQIQSLLRDAGLLDTEGLPMVATVSPVIAIESHLPIYAELSTGSFLYRIGDLMTEEERRNYTATSISTIHQLFDANPPAAILVTNEGDVEIPLAEYAKAHNYTLLEQDFTKGDLYIR